jgi:pectate lyase
MNPWKAWLENLKAKPYSALGLLVLLAIPVTLILVSKQQNFGSHAAAPDQLETEIGTLSSSGATKITDSSASGGQYVRLDTITSTPTPTPIVNPTPTTAPTGPVKAFPSAVGWGKNATGGRGGIVLKVTNLNNSGTGSLRAAWEDTRTATIVFEVAGTINLSSSIKAKGNKTIAGETAFRNGGQGLTLKRDATYNDGTVNGNLNNTIIRFMRFRPGPGPTTIVDCCGDAITATGNSQNTIIDHSSLSWSTDETLNFWGGEKYITLQNIIFAEPLWLSTHYEGGVQGNHGFAFLSGGDDANCTTNPSFITFYNTIWAHSDQRNPRIAGVCKEHELVNTLLYNWGHFGSNVDAGKEMNIINHYAINGANTSTARYPVHGTDGTGVRLYVKGIYNAKNNNGALGDWAGIGCENCAGYTYMTGPAPTSWQASAPYNYPLKDYPKLTKEQVKSTVTANAGATLYRDAVDQRTIIQINTNTGSKIDSPSDVGGWPTLSNMSSVPLDTDDDGMPDAYEVSKGLNKSNAADGAANSGDGYTNLEKYLFTLTGD